MEKFEYVDLFASKGATYILVIIFLITFVFFIKYINGQPAKSRVTKLVEDLKLQTIGWFRLAENYFYHQGHGWIAALEGSRFKIGIDDFAQKMLGTPNLILPATVGKSVTQGKPIIEFVVDEKSFAILSPVSGKITAINNDAVKEPKLINNDPYNKGWLFEIIPDDFNREKAGLLSGNLAKSWIENVSKKLNSKISGQADIVLQDGGEIATGFIKELDKDNWDIIAKEFLLN